MYTNKMEKFTTVAMQVICHYFDFRNCGNISDANINFFDFRIYNIKLRRKNLECKIDSSFRLPGPRIDHIKMYQITS